MKPTSIFSENNPTLRLVWDATTLAAFMLDPLTYYWKYVLGYRSRKPSIDLLWGTAWDKSIGFYHQARTAYPREDALIKTIKYAIKHAWKVDLDAVAAESKYKANKKNLSTLIRSLVWYDDEHGDYDMYEPYYTQPTKAIVKLPLKTLEGEQYWIVANFDQLVRELETGRLLVVERKSTSSTISRSYWEQYDPCVQTSVYHWTCSRMGAGHEGAVTNESIVGVMMEAVQTAVGFSRFDFHEVRRTELQHYYWERTMCYWIRAAEFIAANEVPEAWAVAANVAGQRWESTTRRIQRESPAAWDGLLETEMEWQEPWNPLEVN